jgi:Cytosol aminopeptidase family, N-terminal domain
MHDIKDLDADAVIVGFHEDVRPLKGAAGALDWLLCGALSQLIIQNKVRGALGEVALLTSRGKIPADKIFMVGLGQRGSSLPVSLRAAARAAAVSAVNAGVARSAVCRAMMRSRRSGKASRKGPGRTPSISPCSPPMPQPSSAWPGSSGRDPALTGEPDDTSLQPT